MDRKAEARIAQLERQVRILQQMLSGLPLRGPTWRRQALDDFVERQWFRVTNLASQVLYDDYIRAYPYNPVTDTVDFGSETSVAKPYHLQKTPFHQEQHFVFTDDSDGIFSPSSRVYYDYSTWTTERTASIFDQGTGTEQTTDDAQLGDSGSGTITTTGDFDDAGGPWPSVGYAQVLTASGGVRETIYYSSRTSTSLTVDANGRGQIGTSADAGESDDTVVPGDIVEERQHIYPPYLQNEYILAIKDTTNLVDHNTQDIEYLDITSMRRDWAGVFTSKAGAPS